MDTKRARRFLFWVFAGMGIGLVILAGCEALDRFVTDANNVASTTKIILDSPAGQALPPPVGLYGGIATTLIMGGAAAYKQWRLSQMSKTTKAIVRGIEASGKPAGEEAGNPSQVKAAIAVEMRKLGVYDAGNKLVDRLKVS